MATRSHIIAQLKSGIWGSIYVHHNGDPEDRGSILTQHYMARTKVLKLLEHGSVSTLAASIVKPAGHSFATPVDGYTVFYGRDRGEAKANVKARHHVTLNEALEDCDEEFVYVFRDGSWWWTSQDSRTVEALKPLLWDAPMRDATPEVEPLPPSASTVYDTNPMFGVF